MQKHHGKHYRTALKRGLTCTAAIIGHWEKLHAQHTKKQDINGEITENTTVRKMRQNLPYT